MMDQIEPVCKVPQTTSSVMPARAKKKVKSNKGIIVEYASYRTQWSNWLTLMIWRYIVRSVEIPKQKEYIWFAHTLEIEN